MKSKRVAVIGGGLAGIAAAHRLSQAGVEVSVYEKNSYLGGHATSHTKNGFTFDEGPHVSFTKNADIRSFLEGVCGGQVYEYQAKILNYWNGCLIPHPVQANLFGLPRDIRESCVSDYTARQSPASEPANYREWCLNNFGKTISQTFFFPYTKKYWTLDAADLTCDWVGKRIYVPSNEEIIAGAGGQQATNQHYITSIRYPKHGGFKSFIDFAPKTATYFKNAAVQQIEAPKSRQGSWRVMSSDRVTREFDKLICSVPLPDLVTLMKSAPEPVIEAAAKLFCTSTVLVNLGLKDTNVLPDAHWLYVYDPELIFSRIHFPHRLSPANSPEGCVSLQAEIYYSKSRPLPGGDLVKVTIDQLCECKIISDPDAVVFSQLLDIPYANVVFDFERSKALQIINAYLDDCRLFRSGRYGNWDYYWTDDTILSSWTAVDRLLAEEWK